MKLEGLDSSRDGEMPPFSIWLNLPQCEATGHAQLWATYTDESTRGQQGWDSTVQSSVKKQHENL